MKDTVNLLVPIVSSGDTVLENVTELTNRKSY